MTWVTGTLRTRTNAVFTVANDGQLDLVPGNYKVLSGTLMNSGVTRMIGDTALYLDNNPVAQLVNLAGGLLDLAGSGSFEVSGTGGGVIDNRGTFRKSAGGDSAISGSLVFTNSSIVDVVTNALEIRNGWHDGARFTGEGFVRFVNANYLRNDITGSNLVFQSGGIDGTGGRLHGHMTWVTGTLGTSTNAVFTVANDGQLDLVPGSYKYLAGNLNNSGLTRLKGTALYFYYAPASRIVNFPDGIVDSAGNDFLEGDGNPNRSIENRGLFRKSGGGGETLVRANIAFANPGRLDLQVGTISIEGAYTGTVSEMRVQLRSPSDYGRLRVSGPLTLGGSLVVVTPPGFSAPSNTVFAIVRTRARAGTFVSASGLTFDNGLSLALSNLDLGVDLVVKGRDLRPVLQSARLNQGQFAFEFLSEPGVSYILEFNDDLNTTHWQTRKSIAGDGTLITFGEPPTHYPARFFRIRRN